MTKYFGFFFELFGHRCVARVSAEIPADARDRMFVLCPSAVGVELLTSGPDEKVQKEMELVLSKRSEVCPSLKKPKKVAPHSQLAPVVQTLVDRPKSEVPVQNLWIPG